MNNSTVNQKKHRAASRFLSSLLICGALTSGTALHAAVELGGLMQKDVTDPTNAIHIANPGESYSLEKWQQFYAPAAWTSISAGHESIYADNECPANIFNNATGPNAYKWYDRVNPSAANPSYVNVTFPNAFVMTHFTLTSANDSWANGRQPNEWSVYGSNDGGETWNLIYHADSSADFTQANNRTVLYSSFTNDTLSSTVLNSAQQAHVNAALGDRTISTADFTNTTPYSSYRLEITSTTGNGGRSAEVQLGEWEIYGNRAATSTLKTSGNSLFTQLTADSEYAMDAQNASTLTADANGKVSEWRSANGNGLTFNQSNDTYKPSLSTVTIDEKEFNALNFETASGKVRSDFLKASALVYAQTVLILAQNEGANNLMSIWGEEGDYGIRLHSGNKRWQGGSITNTGNEGEFIHTVNADKSHIKDGQYFYNGTAEASGSSVSLQNQVYLTQAVRQTPFSMAHNVIGDYFSLCTAHGNRGYDGNIMEVIVFDRALNSVENRLVNTYFQSKYGVQIAGAANVNPADNKKFCQDLLAVVNLPYTDADGQAQSYIISESGMNGIAIGTLYVPTVNADAPFDIFTTYGPSAGTEVYAVTNIAGGETFGTTAITTADGTSMEVWDKQLYITNASAEGTEAWDVTLTFNGEEAGLEEAGKDLSDWNLLFRETEDDAFSVIAGLNAVSFNDGYLDFTFSSDLLNTGFYALGTNSRNVVPEPGTMILLLLGASGLFILRRRQKPAAV